MYTYKAIVLFLALTLLFSAHVGTTTFATQSTPNPSNDDWSMFNHDSQHTGFSPSSVPESPNLIWTFPDPNITSVEIDYTFITSTPVIAKGFLYISRAKGGGFYALNASTGELLWKYLTIFPQDLYATHNNMLASPAIANGNIYVGTNEGNVLAFGDKSTTAPPLDSKGTIEGSTLIAVIGTATVAVLICACLLFYFKKLKHN